MMQNKKAITRTVLISIIMTLFCAAIIFIFLPRFGYLFHETIDKEVCRDSVLLRSANIGRFFVPLRCKTQYACLSMGGNCPKKYAKVSVKDEADIRKKIAERMYDCWWMLGEGKLDFVSDWQGGTYGIICSVMTFDDNLKQKYSVIEGIEKYLFETKVPSKNFTYFQYLANNPSPVSGGEEMKASYSTEKPIAIVFVIAKYSSLSEMWKSATAGAATGAIAGFILPGVGNALGAGVGGLIGGAGMWVKSYLHAPEAVTGIFIVPYTAEGISGIAQTLESTP